VEFILRSLVIGIGATALFDLWGLALHLVFGLPAPAWGMGGALVCPCGAGPGLA
jgi:hypothetical protein